MLLTEDNVGRKTRELKMTVYDIPFILKGLGVDEEEFIEVSILCGTDFTNLTKIPGIGPVNALKKIKQYRTIEKMIYDMDDPQKNKIPKEFNPSDARKIFYRFLKMPQVPENIQTASTSKPDYDHMGILKFLQGKLTQYQQYAIKWTKSVTGVHPGKYLLF
jgi:hypothetical protein